ncbi:MAG TPA: AI-2E family transporter [Thermohalobaculum sp.]|nr:AI-2E family transporter [Thermohalobaculum sp.]
MTIGAQLRWWASGLAVLVLLLWLLSDALLPFVLGAALAYLTDPLADRLQRMGMSRIWATVLVTVVALSLAVLAVLLIIPILAEQIRSVVVNAPAYVEWVRNFVATWLPALGDESSPLRGALDTLRERAQGWSLSVLERLWSGSLAVVDFVSLLVITPVVAFYLLLDWDRMIAWIDDCLPRDHLDTIRKLMTELDQVLAGFLRGQLSVCAILGAYYAIGLTVIGLEFGFLIGAFAGLISFIPFVGSIVGGALSIGVAVAQFWTDPAMIGAVAAVFVVGQLAEGNLLTPKFIGGKIGLHPVWLIFALSAFGSLFGAVGLLIAVPAAAGIGVFGRFLVGRYKQARLYIGTESSRPGEAGE